MATALLFNPQNDLALAAATESYTPPRAAAQFAAAGALLPAWWAGEDDTVVAPGLRDDAAWLRREYGLRFNLGGAEHCTSAAPWGWSRNAVWLFERTGMSPAVLPSEFDIEHYRDLSHRKTAMKVRALLGVFPGYLATDLDAARQIIDKRGMRLYAKSPWSCSGRGVMPLERMSVSAALSHVAGIIRRQGSVLLEEAWPQGTDIAALYVRRGETVEFNGWSMFESSPTGAYAGNIVDSQQQLERMIGERTDIAALRDIATRTGHALEKVLTGCFYNGQLGVDMLIAPDGRVNPCIEVNLRRTMGFVARDIHNRLGIEGRLEMSAPPGATMLCPPRGSFSIGVTPRAGA